jgi:hypothetical protein
VPALQELALLAERAYRVRRQKAPCGFSLANWTSAGKAVAVLSWKDIFGNYDFMKRKKNKTVRKGQLCVVGWGAIFYPSGRKVSLWRLTFDDA